LPRDKTANHIKIMAAARQEFLEMGFEKASMRGIADRCSMTAAGIYRHCIDKEDLFYQVVTPAHDRLMGWAGSHRERYENSLKSKEAMSWNDSYIDMMREIVYPNMEDYYLLIARSKGTKYENYLHDLTGIAQTKILEFMKDLKDNGGKVNLIPESQLHILLTAYVTALFEPVMHNYDIREAMQALNVLEGFFTPGWKRLMGMG